MSDQQAHTPEPWVAVNRGTDDEPHMSVMAARIAGRPPGHEVAIVATGDSPQWMEDANAARIVACVNGCAGLNPAGVKGAVEAAEKLSKRVEDYIEDLRRLSTGPDDYAESCRVENELNEYRAALAKLREDA